VSGDLKGLTLTPGVYRSESSLGLTGTLTLDGQGDPNAVFIFQAPDSTLTTASNSRVNLINGAQACNVFWQVGSSATLGGSTGGSFFAGNILALTSITINGGVTVDGRALARNGAVTLNNDTITAARGATDSGAADDDADDDDTDSGATDRDTTSSDTPVADTTVARNGTAVLRITPRTRRAIAKTVAKFGTSRCTDETSRPVVTGSFIRSVVFSRGGRVYRNPQHVAVPGVGATSPRPQHGDGSRHVHRWHSRQDAPHTNQVVRAGEGQRP
jgi:hypothetical protein